MSTQSFLRLTCSASEVRAPPHCVALGQMRPPGLGAEPRLRDRAVGPSSSHTVGPMRAGKIFIGDLEALGLLEKVSLWFRGCVAFADVLPSTGPDRQDHPVSDTRPICHYRLILMLFEATVLSRQLVRGASSCVIV